MPESRIDRSACADPGATLASVALCCALLSSCATPARPPEPTPTPKFREVTGEVGIRHRHLRPVLDPKLDNIGPWMSSVGAAAAAADVDGDGRIDLYVTNSRAGESNWLYLNRGDGSFLEAAERAGLADVNGRDGSSMDATFGDYDNDGDPDLYLVRWGRDALFRNDGAGVFVDVTAELFRRRDASAGTDWANGNAAIFFDFDLDGRLDIYVGNYFSEVDLAHLADTRIMHDDFEVARNAGKNFLYHQRADGTFEEIAGALGVDDSGWTLAVGSADLNNDGWPDLYVANDFGPDRLFLGGSRNSFENVTETAIGKDTKKGMNVDFGDYDNDGWLDAYVTNITTSEYLQEGNMLWHNNGVLPGVGFSMTDVAAEAHVDDGGWGWGGKFFDADNDGDLDIVTVNGFVSAGPDNYWYDLATWTVTDSDPIDARAWPPMGDRSFSGYEKTRLFVNIGREAFIEAAAGAGIASDRDGRGIVAFDFDDDGRIDLFVANQNQEPQLYRNETPSAGHWLGLRLVADPATGINRDAIGTRVTVVTGDVLQIREQNGGKCYAGQSDPRLHFGLGDHGRVDLVEVRWPDGGIQYLEAPPIDDWLVVRQQPQEYASQVALVRDVPQARQRTGTTVFPKPTLAPADLDRLLTEVEREIAKSPRIHAIAGRYRRLAAENGAHDRAIAFLGRLADDRAAEPEIRVEFANAYVDKLPTCGGIAAIVCKGTQARRALDQLDRVIAAEPELWSAVWSRGMNHLHWPRALRHSAAAAADLERCLALSRRGLGPETARLHVAIGDAWVKAGEFVTARRLWREAALRFPQATELADRIRIVDDAELLAFVEAQRSLEQSIDTDLGFLESRR